MPLIRSFTVPAAASEQGKQQLRFLAALDRSLFKKNAGKSDRSDVQSLQYLAKDAGVWRDAVQPSGTMWNPEYVAALILQRRGHSDAIPEGWLVPRVKNGAAALPTAPVVTVTAPAPAAVPDLQLPAVPVVATVASDDTSLAHVVKDLQKLQLEPEDVHKQALLLIHKQDSKAATGLQL